MSPAELATCTDGDLAGLAVYGATPEVRRAASLELTKRQAADGIWWCDESDAFVDWHSLRALVESGAFSVMVTI